MLNGRLNFREMLVDDATQAFCVLPKSLGDQRGVEEQMDATFSAIEQPLRLHAHLPRPAPSGRALLGHSLFIGREGCEIELRPLHESCR